MAYTSRKINKKSKPKRGMRKKTVRSRKPKRTIRKSYSRCGEGSLLTGWSKCQAIKLAQIFAIEGNNGSITYYTNEGAQISGNPPEMLTQTRVQVTPSQAFGLTVQKSVHKHWRINGVKYQFYKDSLDPNNGSIASANYIGSFTPMHSKAIYDPLNDALPLNKRLNYSAQLDQWLSQQKGELLPTLNGKKKTIYCKSMVQKSIKLLGTAGYTDQDNLIKFPWINSGVENTFYAGQLSCYIPVIKLKPLLSTGIYDTATGPGLRTFFQKFQWYVTPTIHWSVKGKYYTDDAIPETRMEQEDPDNIACDFWGRQSPQKIGTTDT